MALALPELLLVPSLAANMQKTKKIAALLAINNRKSAP